jgi:ABC-type spermidine/putrescine transport system permease subunit I
VSTALCFSAGLAAGIVVTKRLHGDPEAGIWGERIADTRLRYANIPVGGTIALVLSAFLPERWAAGSRALGTGALLGAVGWGIVDPLPPVS